jgi:tetratricopeptide (TPR) repeat protein
MGLHGAVPRKLTPVFRDRDELSSSADLSENIREALVDSESLVVLCSPGAAGSQWVNEEIRYFRSLGRGHRIYCVIVDGDPHASESNRSCFPQALTDGTNGAVEPLAADIRKAGDGKRLAKLKLVAGILGVGLDELRRRDKQRQRKLQLLAGLAALFLAVLLFSALQSRMAEKEARLAREAQQKAAEVMLADFLEQADRLSDVADLETRKAFSQVLSSYLAVLNPSDLTFESRRQLGVVLSNRGVILLDEGQLVEAMQVFQTARDTLSQLVKESAGDAEALFELSQIEYWIGQVHLDWGQMDEAEEAFRSYADISIAMNQLRPDNADWTMEVAYAQSNLGNLEGRRIPSDPQLVLKYHQTALKYNLRAAQQDDKYDRELAESYAYLADAWLLVCDLDQASINRLKNVELAEKHYRLNPNSNRLKRVYTYALVGLSRVHHKAGRMEDAMTALKQSILLQKELVVEDPSNLRYRWNWVRSSAYQARFLELAGREKESWEMSRKILTEMTALADQDWDIRIDHAIDHGKFLREHASRARMRSMHSKADQLIAESIKQLKSIAMDHPDNVMALNELALTYFQYWERHQHELPENSAGAWLIRARELSNLSSCSELDIASRLAIMSGEQDEAATFVSRLVESGYQEPSFMQFCQAHTLCVDNR